MSKTITNAEPTLNLRFLGGRLQQEWLVYVYLGDVDMTKSFREWRDVPSAEKE